MAIGHSRFKKSITHVFYDDNLLENSRREKEYDLSEVMWGNDDFTEEIFDSPAES